MTKLLIKVDFEKEMERVSKEVERLATFEIHQRIDYATRTLKEVCL